MFGKIKDFLTYLTFKRYSRKYSTPRKKREPQIVTHCVTCGETFEAFNKRQRLCTAVTCRKVDRAARYRKLRAEWKANAKAVAELDKD